VRLQQRLQANSLIQRRLRSNIGNPPKNADCAAIFMLSLVRYIPVAMPTYRDPFTVNESIGDWRDFRNSSAAPAIPGADPSGCLASWTKWL